MSKAIKKHREFGRRLRMAREALGIDVAKDFARKIQIHEQTYGNWERGDRFPDGDALAKFADEGMSLDYLILGRGPVLKIQKAEKAS